MLKASLTILTIILVNLLAFLSVGHILDALFKTEALWKITFLVISIIPLYFFMFSYIKKLQADLQELSKEIPK